IFLYDGKTGEKLHELVSADQHHTGGIFSVAWSPDSSRLLTSSADSTVKIWDVQAQSVVRTFDLSTAAATPDTQQVGNLWQGDHLLSLALSGEINYLDPNSGEVARTVKGHQKAITALTIGAPSSATFFTGSYDGRAHAWHYGRDADRAVAEPLKGDGHANQITAMAIAGDAVFSAGMDDVVKFASVEKVGATTVPTGSQPRYVSASPSGTLVVATIDNVQAYDRTGHRLATLSNPGFNPTAVAITPDAQTVIVGGDDNRSRAYRLADGALTLLPDLELASNRGAITALAVSPQGTHLAAGDAQGKIFVYDLGTGEVVVTQWVFHSARVNSLAWSANGKFVVSGSLDTNVFVWNLDKPGKRVQIKKAHIAGVNGVGWAGEREVVSVGQDATVKVWEVVLPQ
ncbi:quinon protein alcohol dehydrogenase-like superfamily, partial [Jimgerdemannia flammicorona]